MRNQPLILLVVAVGCGLVAMLGVRQALNQKGPKTEETIQVLSANALIQPGDRLDDVNTRFVAVPATSCPEGAITSMEDVAERALMVPVMPGDWILKAKLTEKGELGAMANLPQGMAAVTIPVDATTSHSGMLRPGYRVDLLLTFSDSTSGTSQQKTITVLEFVEVFAVDSRVYGIDKDGDAAAKNISLLVTPEQGKAVTLATKVGTLSTMMRRGDAVAKGQTEISQEFLTSSFMGSNRNAPSVMDRMDSDVLPEQNAVERTANATLATSAAMSVDELIGREMGAKSSDPGGSEPVVVAEVAVKNTWTMEIYEGETVRLESIEIPEIAKAEMPAASSADWSVWDLLKTR